jgi:hypothetical protein
MRESSPVVFFFTFGEKSASRSTFNQVRLFLSQGICGYWYFVPLIYYSCSFRELRSLIRRTLEVDSGIGNGSAKSLSGRTERA